MKPVELVNAFIQKSSQVGKTAMLIDSLPNEKCAVFTSSYQSGLNLKKRITEQRPDYNVNNITFVSYTKNSGWRDKLLSKDMDVYFDNDTLDQLLVHHVEAINKVYGKQKDIQ
jgi:hypothetical protein